MGLAGAPRLGHLRLAYPENLFVVVDDEKPHAALAGEAVARSVPEVWIRRVAGLGFLVLGALFLVGRE